MANADVSFGVLGTELWSPAGLGLGQRMLRRFGRRGCSTSPGTPWRRAATGRRERSGPTRRTACSRPGSPHRARPENAVSGFMTQVIACAVSSAMPVPVGGGVRLVEALSGIVRDAGGELGPTPRWSRSSSRGAARPGSCSRAASRSTRRARWSSASLPTQLYGRLLRAGDVPADVTDAAARYRYGRAGMQIHIAMDEPPRWKGADAQRLGRTAIVHVTPGLDGVSRAVTRPSGVAPRRGDHRRGPALRGRRLARSRGQVDRLDPAPGASRRPREGDAAGELDVGDGTWTETLREATPIGSSPGSASRSRTSRRPP